MFKTAYLTARLEMLTQELYRLRSNGPTIDRSDARIAELRAESDALRRERALLNHETV